MRTIRDTKGNALYTIKSNEITSDLAVDRKSLLKIVREDKLIVNKGRK